MSDRVVERGVYFTRHCRYHGLLRMVLIRAVSIPGTLMRPLGYPKSLHKGCRSLVICSLFVYELLHWSDKAELAKAGHTRGMSLWSLGPTTPLLGVPTVNCEYDEHDPSVRQNPYPSECLEATRLIIKATPVVTVGESDDQITLTFYVPP